MLTCKDELRRIKVMTEHREHVFETLRKDVERFEEEDLAQGKLPEHGGEVSAVGKVQTALLRTQQQSKVYDHLFEDITMTLDSVRSNTLRTVLIHNELYPIADVPGIGLRTTFDPATAIWNCYR